MNFFKQLGDALAESHEMIGSCNHDSSVYLIPKGQEDELTYYGKPIGSFRVSDHWNWFSTLEKCSKPAYVQCCSVDMPRARQRPEEGVPSEPMYGSQVAVFGKDRRYHCVFGEKYDRRTRTWSWVEGDLQEAIETIR